MIIAERIKKRRIELGLSAEDIANYLGVSRATVYRYESADIENMGIDKIEPLAEVLRTTPSYLMGWTEEPLQEKTTFSLTTHEKRLVTEYRQQPHSQYAVDKILGISDETKDIESILQMLEVNQHNQFSTAAYGGNNLHGQAKEDKEAIERILKNKLNDK